MHPAKTAPASTSEQGRLSPFRSDRATPASAAVASASPKRGSDSSYAPLNRAAAVLEAMAADRTVSDAELRQHAMDCAWLLEQAYARFERFGDESGREEAIRWNTRRADALKALSPAWKAAREAQIQADIAAGGHLEHRAALAGRAAG